MAQEEITRTVSDRDGSKIKGSPEEVRKINMQALDGARGEARRARVIAVAHPGVANLVETAPDFAADLAFNTMLNPADPEEAKRIGLAVLIALEIANRAKLMGTPFNMVSALLKLTVDNLITNAENAAEEGPTDV